MIIQRLELFTPNLKAQFEFYATVLKVPAQMLDANQFQIRTRNTNFLLTACDFEVHYHYAFLIDDSYFESALEAVRNLGVPMIYDTDGSDIIHWGDGGRTFYFIDYDGNIGEFITRPDTGTVATVDGPWDFSQLMAVNEIGTPVNEPLKDAQEWIRSFKLDVPAEFQKRWSARFCWTGDHNGVLLVVSTQRDWYLTETRAISSPLNVDLITHSGICKLQFRNGIMERIG